MTLSNPNVGSTQIPIPLSRTGGCGSPISRSRDRSREDDGNSEARGSYGEDRSLGTATVGVLSAFEKADPPESGRTGEVLRLFCCRSAPALPPPATCRLVTIPNSTFISRISRISRYVRRMTTGCGVRSYSHFRKASHSTGGKVQKRTFRRFRFPFPSDVDASASCSIGDSVSPSSFSLVRKLLLIFDNESS